MSGMRRGFDWPALMRVGLRDMGLAPDVFWSLTPAELWLILGPDVAQRPLGRSRLDELSAAYPDVGPGEAGNTDGEDDG